MLKFSKMQGLGNDYICIDCTKHTLQYSNTIFAKYVCDRRFSVGADGLILIYPSKIADVKMRIFNSDGTEAGMCGNGIRCLGKYVYEKGLVQKEMITVETLSGIKTVKLSIEGKTVTSVQVDMGQAMFSAKKIPLIIQNYYPEHIWHTIQIEYEKKNYQFDCVSMGNPHAVTIVDKLDTIDIKKLGAYVENYKNFPAKTNVEFVQIIDRNNIKMKVWERGVGETMACGTGACAAAVISYVNKLVDHKVTVQLDGGRLEIEIGKTILMTGEANFSYEGVLDL